MHEEKQGHAAQQKSFLDALPKSVHLAVPVGSVLMLVLLATMLTTGNYKLSYVFIPIFLFMVIVYVFASMYLFKRLMDTEEPGPGH